jgi:hypothetical protein
VPGISVSTRSITLEDMPVIRLGVSHWTDPDSAVDEIQWFLAQFSTAYRGSVVLTRSEYQLATALNSLSCLHSYELSIKLR